MSEELLVRHCAPTLAGLKTANLFACRFSDGDALRRCLCCWNRRLMKKLAAAPRRLTAISWSRSPTCLAAWGMYLLTATVSGSRWTRAGVPRPGP